MKKLISVLLVGIMLSAVLAVCASASALQPWFPDGPIMVRTRARITIPVRCTATLTVTDEKGNAVEGAKYTLYRHGSKFGSLDTIVGEYVTDKDGKIFVTHLSPDEYFFMAVGAPKGFEQDTEIHTFNVYGNGIVALKVVLLEEKVVEPVVEETADEPAIADEAVVVAEDAAIEAAPAEEAAAIEAAPAEEAAAAEEAPAADAEAAVVTETVEIVA